MAEFGIRATELANPQGAGSAPIAPVEQPSFQGVDLSGLGNLFKGIGKDKEDKPWMALRNDYAKKLTGIQEAALSGGIDERRAYNQMKLLTVQYQRQGADYGTDYTKSISDTFTQLRLGTGIEELQDINKADTKTQVDAAEGLRKAGVFVAPLAEQTQQDRDFITRTNTELNNLQRIADETQKALDIRNKATAEDRATQEFAWKQQDMRLKQNAQHAVSNLKSDHLAEIPNAISEIRKRGGTPEEQRLVFERHMAGLSNVAGNILTADPASLKSYQDTLQGLVSLGRDMFDPTKELKQLEGELKRRITVSQLTMTEDPTILRAAGVDKLLANSPAATMATANAANKILMNDLKMGTTSGHIPTIVSNDQAAQRQTYKTVASTIANVTAGRSQDPAGDMDAAGKMASSTMKTMGMLNSSSNVSLELTKDFIASPEFGELIKAGKFDVDAANQARPVYQDLYMSAFGEQFFKSLGQTIGDVNYVDGKPDPGNATLGRIMDLEMTADGSVKAVKKISPDLKISASPMYIDRQIRAAQQLADGLTKAVKASAHLDGRTDYTKYWEENKHYLVRGVFPPPEHVEKLKSQGYIGTGSALNPANYRKPDGTGE